MKILRREWAVDRIWSILKKKPECQHYNSVEDAREELRRAIATVYHQLAKTRFSTYDKCLKIGNRRR
jgi:hypothetical protein